MKAWLKKNWYWVLGGVLLAATVFLQGPMRKHARAILDRVKLRELEAERDYEAARVEDAKKAELQANTRAKAAKAETKAHSARVRANAAEQRRKEIATNLAQGITDEERARRFRKRHGLSDPRSDTRS